METTKDKLIRLLERRVFNADDLADQIDYLYKQEQALQLLQPDVSGSKCNRHCKNCHKIALNCTDFCSQRCETAYYR